MTPEAKVIWAGLELRTPAMLRLVDPLVTDQLLWQPTPGGNSIAWHLWHITEVEDNWVRTLLCAQPRRFPFGRSVREAARDQYPEKSLLLEYFHEVRGLSRQRLAATAPADFDRLVQDHVFGPMAGHAVWSGVVTSFAWHAGQIALTARLLRECAPLPGVA